MARKKPEPVEGVALSLPDDTPDRYAENGVALRIPEDDSTPEPKSGQKAAAKKES